LIFTITFCGHGRWCFERGDVGRHGEAAAADGISHIVCSPHANGTYAYEPLVIAEKMPSCNDCWIVRLSL